MPTHRPQRRRRPRKSRPPPRHHDPRCTEPTEAIEGMAETNGSPWAHVLGAASGFAAATALELARSGMNIFGVHRDRVSTLPAAKQVQAEIEATGRRAIFFNVNAVGADKRAQVIETMRMELAKDGGTVRVLLH